MDNFRRSIKRLVTRLTILALVVVCGAIAIAQANRNNPDNSTSQPDVTQPPTALAGISQLDDPNLTPPLPSLREPQLRQQQAMAAGSPARAVEVIRDDQVRPVQAEIEAYESRFELPNNSLQDSAGPDPLRDPSMSQFSDAPPLEDDGGDALDTPPLRDVAADVPDSGQYADAAPWDGGADLGDQVDVELADGFRQQQPVPPAENRYDGLADPATPADSQPAEPQSEYYDDAMESVAGTQDVSGRFGGGREDGFRANPMRLGGDATLPGPAQPAPLTSEPPGFENTPDGYRDDTPELDDSFAYTGVAGSGDVALVGVGRPGPRELEGTQTPSLSVRKVAPANVRVGQLATFQIKVRNVGQVPADRVLVRDEVPSGTQLVDTNPQATTTAEGAVLWELGTMRPGDEVTVSMQVTPRQEGQIGSVATLTFQASASARAEVTKPLLAIEHSGPRQVLIGQRVNFTIQLSNPGSGPVTGVVLEEDVPAGLSHAKGPQLEYEVGTIPAGRTRRLELSLTADKPGLVENVVVARAEGGLMAEHRLKLEVIAPELAVKVVGPKLRYLERKATFQVAIENPGSAPAKNVELMTRLPRGLRFVSTNNSGRYDRATNTVRWSLDRLPAGQYGEVKFTAVPTTMGDYDIHAEATADMGLRDEKQHRLRVEGLAALLFSVADQTDPIEVGGSTTYEIRVKNQGTKAASNVQFVALLPPGMQAMSGEGASHVRIEGDRVLFAPIEQLPAKGEASYTVRVKGVQAGDQRFRIRMTSDDTSAPVIKEESTRVYAD